MGPMFVPPAQHEIPMVLPLGAHANGSMHGSVQGTLHGNNQMLDFLESQVRTMDVGAPLQRAPQYVVAPQQMGLQPQPVQPMQPHTQPMQPHSQAIPFTPGPPSMLSALDEMGVQGMERRVIQLPPIVGRAPSLASRRAPRDNRGILRFSSQSSSSSNRTRHPREDSQRNPGSQRRGILRSYSDESDWDDRHGGRGSRGRREGSGGGRSRPQARSKEELIEELQRANLRRGSWSSEEDSHRGAARSRDRDWPEKPPSYSSIEIRPGQGRRSNERHSVRIMHPI